MIEIRVKIKGAWVVKAPTHGDIIKESYLNGKGNVIASVVKVFVDTNQEKVES